VTAKETVIEMVQTMPDDASVHDIAEKLYLRTLISPFDDPDFSQRIIEHIPRAKRAAIAEAREAELNDNA